MAKSDRATIERRLQEILRILIAGGEFEDIRNYAAERGWNLSERQLRRYSERVYEGLAEVTKRDQKQLLGRHLMQRRALFARAMKNGDLRTALHVLRDEAELEGLYPPTKIAPTTPDGLLPYPGPAGAPLSREERFVRLMSAEFREDKTEIRLIETTTPQRLYKMPDTQMPRQMLNIQSLIYVADQLDHASYVFMAMWQLAMESEELSQAEYDFIGSVHAYRFKIERDGWGQYTSSLGVDSQKLIAENHFGTMLEMFGDQIYDLAPSEEAMRTMLTEVGSPIEELPTAAGIARQWRKMLDQVLR